MATTVDAEVAVGACASYDRPLLEGFLYPSLRHQRLRPGQPPDATP